MATLYEAARDGSLESLAPYRSESFDIDEPDAKGRTALAYAAWKGHVSVVKLLVGAGANVNKLNDKSRTALWYASVSDPSVTKQKRLEVVEHLLFSGANPNLPAQDGTTAIVKLIEHREPRAIKLLAQRGALMEVTINSTPVSVQSLAEATSDPAVIQAVNPSSGRNEIVTETVTYILKSLGYMNLSFGGTIRKLFHIKGDVKANLMCAAESRKSDDADAAPETNKNEALKNRIFGFDASGTASVGLGEPEDNKTLAMPLDAPAMPRDEDDLPTPEEFHATMTKYIEETGLSDFFPEGDTFLQTVANKAAYLKTDPNNTFRTARDVEDCTKLALYQPVFYCDDSGSMKTGTRVDDQIELVRRVARISTCLVPDGCGTGLQFINDNGTLNDSLSSDQVEERMKSVKPRGNTKIGTHLEQKILKPLVYDRINSGKRLKRPILVSCITDGCAKGEPIDSFKEAILRCVRFLEKNKYPQTAIRFQISQIGNDEGAKIFLEGLRDDEKLKNFLFCTTQRLDEEYQKLNENEEDLERWLLKTLMGPLIGQQK
ncbi:ankyrin repeat [Trichoderma cornu-damae]|uniref:Ankyrin repeat n=1 Tax=Trichoderma cornu-damae TaxID=654480 RepID=A0A9P8TX86_9HYPO|nr:ankyrin repeat [Trichoderma cornu-damae]